MTPHEQRAIEIHTAKVLLTEAINRRASTRSHATFLCWAGNARRRAMAIDISPPQADMFAVSSHHQSTPTET